MNKTTKISKIITLIILIISLLSSVTYSDRPEPQTLSVLIVVDEEYREYYDDWEQRVKQLLEKADDPFTLMVNLDFQVKALGKWESEGKNSVEILENLKINWNSYSYQFIIGVTKDPNFQEGGIAPIYTENPDGSAYSIVFDQGDKTFYSLQHELSHNFGLVHHNSRSGVKCIMNYSYLYNLNTWDEKHIDQLNQNKEWFINN